MEGLSTQPGSQVLESSSHSYSHFSQLSMRPLTTFECPERCIIQNVSHTPGLADVSKMTCLQETPSLGSPSFSISGLQSSNTFMLLPQLLLQQKKKHWFDQIIFTKTSEIQIFIPLPTISHPSSIGHTCIFTRGQCFPSGSGVKNPPAKQEMQVRFLDWEYPLEKEMATHSNILPGKSDEQRNLVGYNPWGNKELDTT